MDEGTLNPGKALKKFLNLVKCRIHVKIVIRNLLHTSM